MDHIRSLSTIQAGHGRTPQQYDRDIEPPQLSITSRPVLGRNVGCLLFLAGFAELPLPNCKSSAPRSRLEMIRLLQMSSRGGSLPLAQHFSHISQSSRKVEVAREHAVQQSRRGTWPAAEPPYPQSQPAPDCCCVRLLGLVTSHPQLTFERTMPSKGCLSHKAPYQASTAA